MLVAFPYSSLSSLVASEICFLGGIIRDTIDVPDLKASKRTKINNIFPFKKAKLLKELKNVDAILSEINLHRLFSKINGAKKEYPSNAHLQKILNLIHTL